MNLRRSISVLIPVFLLSSCFSSGNELDTELQRTSFKTFTIDTPSTWRKISEENFGNTIPDETVALFIHRVEENDFIQNANVVKESLNTEASSLEYAKANILLGSRALIDYRALSTEEVTIQSESTVIHLFRARNSSTDPLRHFTQAYFSRDRVGYTITCISEDENVEQQDVCQSIVRSFLWQG